MFTPSVKTKGNIKAQNEKKDFIWTDCLEEEKEKEAKKRHHETQ